MPQRKNLINEIQREIIRARKIKNKLPGQINPAYWEGAIDGLKKTLEVLDWHAQRK